MKKRAKLLFATTLTVLLVACGGGGGSESSTFTVTRTWEDTTYSCPTQITYDCRASNCGQCTCTVGCDPNAPLVKLAVTVLEYLLSPVQKVAAEAARER